MYKVCFFPTLHIDYIPNYLIMSNTRSKITGKRDMELIEIPAKPVCELALHIQSPTN